MKTRLLQLNRLQLLKKKQGYNPNKAPVKSRGYSTIQERHKIAKITKVARIIYALEQRGCAEVVSNTRKYRKFSHPGTSEFYFVGKNGALRVGRCVSESISLEGNVASLLKRYPMM